MKKKKRNYPARSVRVSEITRKDVIAMFKGGYTQREISRKLQLHEDTVSVIIDVAIVNRELITDITRYMPNPTFTADDYSGASEYTRHFAGAELEDTRTAIERETEQAHPYRYRGIYGRPF